MSHQNLNIKVIISLVQHYKISTKKKLRILEEKMNFIEKLKIKNPDFFPSLSLTNFNRNQK